MWEFMSGVLEKGGVVAALFFLVTIGFGFAVRALWNKNQILHKQLKTQADASRETAVTHAVQLREMASQHAIDRKSQSDEYARQLLFQANKVNDLQERRVEETRTVTEKVITYIGNIEKFANKLEATIDVLLRASERRQP